jgi:hypothetical protein
MVFSMVDSDDEGVQRLDEAAAKGLGSIVVVFEAGTFTTADYTPPPPQPAAADPATLKVHEKSKKRASEVTTCVDFLPCSHPGY